MRNKGTFNFGANLEVKKDAPIDARTLVSEYKDLIKDETWTDSDGNTWLYNGMTVACQDKPGELFQLVDKGKYTEYTSWKTIGAVTEEDLSKYLPKTGGTISGSLSVDGGGDLVDNDPYTTITTEGFSCERSQPSESDKCIYGYRKIEQYDGDTLSGTLSLPEKATGTLALTSDIPTALTTEEIEGLLK